MPFLPVEELQRRASQASKVARQEAWLRGLAVPYIENGKLIREYPDGRKVEIKKLDGTFSEVSIEQ